MLQIMEAILTKHPENVFAPYSLHPCIKILRPLQPLAERLVMQGVLQERASIGFRDLEFAVRFNRNKEVMQREVERIQVDVLKKMGMQNDIDLIHVGRSEGRWSADDFEQVKNNFVVSLSLSTDEMDHLQASGVPLYDPIACIRLRTRQSGETVATVAAWYEEFVKYIPVKGFKQAIFTGIFTIDIERIETLKNSGNVFITNVYVKSPEALNYVNQHLCLEGSM